MDSDQNLGSTNISDLVNNDTDTNDEIVNKILDELEDDNNDSDFMDENIHNDNLDNDFNDNLDDNLDNNLHDNLHNNNIVDMPSMPSIPSIPKLQSSTMDNFSLKNICNLLKHPLSVFIIVLLINNHITIKHFLNIKFLVNDTNELNIIGYVIQAFIISILFLIIEQFILINI